MFAPRKDHWLDCKLGTTKFVQLSTYEGWVSPSAIMLMMMNSASRARESPLTLFGQDATLPQSCMPLSGSFVRA